MNKRIMLVEDHPETLAFLRTCMGYVEPVVEVVGEARDGEQAIAMAIKKRPDVVLMDFVLLPEITGLEASRQILAILPNTRVVLITGWRDPWLYDKARELGIFGLWKKCEPVDEPLNLVTSALQAPSQQLPIVRSQPEVQQNMGVLSTEELSQPLTRTEQRVLGLVALGNTDPETAQQLGISVETVRTHLKHAFKKLAVHKRTQAVLRFIERRK